MKIESFNHAGIEYSIKIGKNANENTEIVKNACESDIWFHVSDSPSCHVILENTIKLNLIPQQVVKRCAYLCKINSSAKSLSKCSIIYTTIVNVQPTMIPGQVVTNNCKTICV